ncbi:MAG TPA: hypothetical protein DDW50_19925 [Firmicutes bacterium]|jgi:hypothetical protein|nr:hypothetical protein [Bacillota bacterium]
MKNLMKMLLIGLVLSVSIATGAVYAEGHNGTGNKGSGQGHVDQQANRGPKDNDKQDKHKVLSKNDAARIAINSHKDANVLSIQHNQNVYIIKIATPVGKWSIYIDDKNGRIVREDREKYKPNPKNGPKNHR